MSVIEKSSLMQYKGADGNMYAVHPVTDTDNVKGLEEWDKAALLGTSHYALPTGGLWQSVCYGNDKFVAVGNNTIAAYSTDGINWTQTMMPVSTNWISVCYGNGTFVAVAINSTIAAYSTDGINWTQTTMPARANWSSVCYGNGKFVTVGNSSTYAAYSTDGINWTQTTMPSTSSWTSVCYGNGKFVAVKYSGNYGAYSADGINWSSIYGVAGINYLKSVCYGNDKFVAVSDHTVAAYSTKGHIGWAATTLPSNALYRSVCYGDGKFVAVAYNSSYVAYSTDGINWTDGVLAVINPAGTDVTNTIKEVLGINGLQVELGGKAPSDHTHTKDQISDFPTSMPASDVKEWAKADTKPTYTASEVGAAAASHTHTKDQISDFPTSMPASDVYAWAKASAKPKYTASEVGADASGAAATALTNAKAYTDSAIQTAIQNTWEASY